MVYSYIGPRNQYLACLQFFISFSFYVKVWMLLDLDDVRFEIL